jgi:hypothetical protein
VNLAVAFNGSRFGLVYLGEAIFLMDRPVSLA